MYYRVKESFDQRKRSDGSILVANELYTPREVERFKIPMECVEEDYTNPKRTHRFFGARFADAW